MSSRKKIPTKKKKPTTKRKATPRMQEEIETAMPLVLKEPESTHIVDPTTVEI
jgi:hypothetical protein